MIFFLFKPLNIKEQNFTDIPLFELETFILYELNTQGLATLMIGTEGIRYANRYQIKDIDYTDNSKQYIANMKAKHSIYQDEIVHLNGDVVYSREDGLVFTTQEIEYNKKHPSLIRIKRMLPIKVKILSEENPSTITIF